MKRSVKDGIDQKELVFEVRRAVSEILGKPFAERIDHKVFSPDKKTLALWAAECAERVLPYFEDEYPDDKRPRKALDTLHAWIDTGEFKMAVIRKASLDAHAAARKPYADGQTAAYFAAHAAGQAVATPHVPTHALGSSLYGIRAVAAHSGKVEDGIDTERKWQLERLRRLAPGSTGATALLGTRADANPSSEGPPHGRSISSAARRRRSRG